MLHQNKCSGHTSHPRDRLKPTPLPCPSVICPSLQMQWEILRLVQRVWLPRRLRWHHPCKGRNSKTDMMLYIRKILVKFSNLEEMQTNACSAMHPGKVRKRSLHSRQSVSCQLEDGEWPYRCEHAVTVVIPAMCWAAHLATTIHNEVRMINCSSQGSQQVKDVRIVVPQRLAIAFNSQHFRNILRCIPLCLLLCACSQIPQDCSCQHEVCSSLSLISNDQPHLGDTKALAARRYAKAFLLGAGWQANAWP